MLFILSGTSYVADPPCPLRVMKSRLDPSAGGLRHVAFKLDADQAMLSMETGLDVMPTTVRVAMESMAFCIT